MVIALSFVTGFDKHDKPPFYAGQIGMDRTNIPNGTIRQCPSSTSCSHGLALSTLPRSHHEWPAVFLFSVQAKAEDMTLDK
jgi:hypothetical protein